RGSRVDPLQKAITARARKAVSTLLENFDAATVLLESTRSEEGAWQALEARIAEAQPAATVLDRPRMLLLGIPASRGGERLRERASRASAKVPTMIVETSGDVLVCHEVANVPLHQALPGPADISVAWAPLAARVSTRTDVAWTGASCSAV
ncbi:MAG TPA: hypothetical protein VKE94_08860, partial [Gemmataceae bacterium]|nr:hypothetical protein [Gemmataceae bacterium]